MSTPYEVVARGTPGTEPFPAWWVHNILDRAGAPENVAGDLLSWRRELMWVRDERRSSILANRLIRIVCQFCLVQNCGLMRIKPQGYTYRTQGGGQGSSFQLFVLVSRLPSEPSLEQLVNLNQEPGIRKTGDDNIKIQWKVRTGANAHSAKYTFRWSCTRGDNTREALQYGSHTASRLSVTPRGTEDPSTSAPPPTGFLRNAVHLYRQLTWDWSDQLIHVTFSVPEYAQAVSAGRRRGGEDGEETAVGDDTLAGTTIRG